MARLDTLVGMAIGTRELDLGETARRFHDFLREQGWEERPDKHDWHGEGQYLDATILDYGDHGRWIYVEELEEPMLDVPKKFALALNEPLEVRQVTVKERRRGSGPNFRIDSKTVRFGPDGEKRDLEFELPDDPELEDGFGDLYETAAQLLGLMVHEGTIAPVSEPKVVRLYRPEPEDEDDIDPRIRNLASEIEEAGEWELVEMMGQQMLRVTLADGTRRTSAISDEEIELLTELTGLEPGS